MKFCLCGCGTEVKKAYVRGHQFRKPAPVPPEVSQMVVEQVSHLPPPHPLPFDHRLYRLAVERPGTLVTDPGREIPCVECHLGCFTREQTAEYGEVICEDCMWRLSQDQGEQQVRQQNRVPPSFNPFE